MAAHGNEPRDRGNLSVRENQELRRLWLQLSEANICYREACRRAHLPPDVLALMGARLHRLAGAYKRRLIELRLVRVANQPPYELLSRASRRQSVTQLGRE
jgi:hypothetical protein